MGKQIYVAKIFENMFLFRGLEAVVFISPLLLILFFGTFMHTNNKFRLLLPLPIPVSLLSQSTSFPLYESLFLIHVLIYFFISVFRACRASCPFTIHIACWQTQSASSFLKPSTAVLRPWLERLYDTYKMAFRSPSSYLLLLIKDTSISITHD